MDTFYKYQMQNSIIFHITAKTPNEEWFPRPLSKAWPICLKSLETFQNKRDFEFISLVLMNNHYHMLAKLPHEKLYAYIHAFHEAMEPRLKFDLQFNAGAIFSHRYLERCYKYIYQNPVRADIARRCENYPYSSLFHLVNKIEFPLTIHDRCGFKDEFGLRWLNSKLSEKQLQEARQVG